MSRYHINIIYSQEDRGYIAIACPGLRRRRAMQWLRVPDLVLCSAFGKTPATALAAVQKAQRAWLAAARAEGKPIPTPRYRPAIYQTAR